MLVVVLFASGCASAKQYVALPDQKVEVENQEMGRIYVLRPSSLGAAISMAVKDDNQLVGDTGAGSFLCWERNPGEAKITGKAENESWVKMYVDKGKRHYVLQRMQMGAFIARNKMEVISEEEGKKYLGKCKPPKVLIGKENTKKPEAAEQKEEK